MKDLKRQDRNGTRTSSDIERKYKLGQIDYTAQEIEELKKKITVDSSLSTSSTNPVQNKVVTKALNNKVSKEEGKGLSSNDFTDKEKELLASLTNVNKDLNNKVDKEEGKGLSSNDFTDELKAKVENGSSGGSSITLLDVYPIGSIYMSVNSTNPSNLFGGTWVAWGTGRVPVGIDTSQTEFATVEKKGGAKTHTLTVNEMPEHRHTIYRTGNNSSAGYGAIFQTSSSCDEPNPAPVGYEGKNQAHNNLQPYITCYMWKRTA